MPPPRNTSQTCTPSMPSLPGRPEQARDGGEARAPAALESGQDVHEIHVPPMKAAQVVAVAEARIALARLPVARRGDAVQEAAIVQYRQIEPRSVPGDEIRRVALESVEKPLDQVLLRGALFAEAPHLERVPRAHDHGNRDHAVLFRRQKFAARILAALGDHDLADLLVGEAREAVQPPPEIGVGHGLDVEHQSIQLPPQTLCGLYA